MANDSLYVTLGEKIRQLRKDKKLTIAQLAEVADIDDYYLGEIERAEKKATLDTLSKLATALDVKLYELLKID